jgi:ketosteroid isomerase-like protein
MSAEANVEIARRFSETISRGDYETAAGMLAPDFTVDDTDLPESPGSDSFYEWIGRWDAAFESWRIEELEVSAIGQDRTLSLFRIYGSGVELARDDAAIADYRDDRIVRIAYYNDQAQALEAAAKSGRP